jgi:hypothetical protein
VTIVAAWINNQGDGRAAVLESARRRLEHTLEIERPQIGEYREHRHQKAEIAYPVDDERLLTGLRLRTLPEPEPDQQIGAEPNTFPTDEHDREARAEHQH